MAEYIERKAFIKRLENEVDRSSDIINLLILNGIANIVRDKNIAPTADVVEVVHGEWVHIKDYGGGKCSGHCSVCWTLQEADNPSALKGSFRYCRWCGAKMDGENSA